MFPSNRTMLSPTIKKLYNVAFKVSSANSFSWHGVPNFTSKSHLSTSAAVDESQRKSLPLEAVQILRLNSLHDNPGAIKRKRRVGRGIGSSKGKTCGRGHKGQKSRSGGGVRPTFEGGQTPLFRLFPKRGFNNARFAETMIGINLGTIQSYITMQRLDPTQPITLSAMKDAGIFKANAIKHGVKLLASGKERLLQPLVIKVNRASASAIAAVEAAGGSVVTVHLNQLALRTELRPEKFVDRILPKQARPPPKYQPYYTSYHKRGYLNPEVQLLNWFKMQKRVQNVDSLMLEHNFQEIFAENKKKLGVADVHDASE